MDTEPRNLKPGSVGAGTGRAADATFQWPPPPQDEGTEPLQANATPAAKPGPQAATQPVPGMSPLVPNPDDGPYLTLQETLRNRHSDAENIEQSDYSTGTRVERPELTSRQAAWLESHKWAVAPAPRVPIAQPLRQPSTAAERTRPASHPPGRGLNHPRRPPDSWLETHMFWVAFALVIVLASAEGIYILSPDSFGLTAPASAVAEAPPTAAPQATAPQAAVPQAAAPQAAAPQTAPHQAAPPKTVPPVERPKEVATTGTAPRGRLSISSDPPGAEVSIDGHVYGLTPLTLPAVTPGERRIVLKLAGREVRQTVQVEPGGTASVIAPMGKEISSPAGWIAVVSKAELDIFEGDVLVGSTRSPQVMMPAGLHTLRLVSGTLGYEATQQIRVEPGKVARIGLTLPDSTINLNALPWAEVWIDGRSVGETPIGNLPLGIGTHQIVFRHPELGEKTLSTVVRADAPARVTVDLRK